MQIYPASNSREVLDKITTDLCEKRFSVTDNFLPLPLYKNISREARRQHIEGLTRPAKIGRLTTSRRNPGIRGDKIRWITKKEMPKNVHSFFDTVEDLRLHLKQSLLLPLNETEQHFAVYPQGAFYRKHLDCHKNANNRILTFILYLNRRNWSHTNGGQLRVWFDTKTTQDFLPLGNRLIIFSSPDYFHSVLPALSSRYSLTGWFKRENLLT